MSVAILLTTLGAGLWHAAWNGLAWVGTSRAQAVMVLSAVQGLIDLVIAAGPPWPGPGCCPGWSPRGWGAGPARCS